MDEGETMNNYSYSSKKRFLRIRIIEVFPPEGGTVKTFGFLFLFGIIPIWWGRV